MLILRPYKPPKIRREDISLIPLIFPRVNGPHSMLYAFTKSLLIRDLLKQEIFSPIFYFFFSVFRLMVTLALYLVSDFHLSTEVSD